METWKAIIIGSLIIALAIIVTFKNDATYVTSGFSRVYYHNKITKKTCFEAWGTNKTSKKIREDILSKDGIKKCN